MAVTSVVAEPVVAAATPVVEPNVERVTIRGRAGTRSWGLLRVRNRSDSPQRIRLVESADWAYVHTGARTVGAGKIGVFFVSAECSHATNLRTTKLSVQQASGRRYATVSRVDLRSNCTAGFSYEPDPAVICNHADNGVAGLYHNASNLPTIAEEDVKTIVRPASSNCGGNLVVPWSRVNPREGEFNWEWVRRQADLFWKPDRDYDYPGGKRVNLLFWSTAQLPTQQQTFERRDGSTGYRPMTPTWVLQHPNVPVARCGIGPTGEPLGIRTPLYYAPTFASRWKQFITLAVRTFEHEHGVGYMRFGAGAGAESYPSNRFFKDTRCRRHFVDFTDNWKPHVESILNHIHGLRSSKPVLFTINDVRLDARDGGSLDGFAESIASLADQKGFGIGTQGFVQNAIIQFDDEFTPMRERCYANWCEFFDTPRASGEVRELQTTRNSNICLGPLELMRVGELDPPNPQRLPGCEPGQPVGYLPDLLRFALDLDVNVFELYWQEWSQAAKANPNRPRNTAYRDALESAAWELEARD